MSEAERQQVRARYEVTVFFLTLVVSLSHSLVASPPHAVALSQSSSLSLVISVSRVVSLTLVITLTHYLSSFLLVVHF